MNTVRKLLLPSMLALIIAGAGMAYYVLASHAASPQHETTVPGLSIAGDTPCQDFLHETQPGAPAITPQNGKITEQAVRSYLTTSHSPGSNPGTVTSVWYFDCGQRTFYYVELTGTFSPGSYPPGATPTATAHEFLLFDAKTGNILRVSG